MVVTSDTTVHNWAKAQIIKEAEELAAFKQTFDAGGSWSRLERHQLLQGCGRVPGTYGPTNPQAYFLLSKI